MMDDRSDEITPKDCEEWIAARVESRLAMFDLLVADGHMSERVRRREEAIATRVMEQFSSERQISSYTLQAFPNANPPDGPKASMHFRCGLVESRLVIANCDVLLRDSTRKTFVLGALGGRIAELIRRGCA